MLHYQISPPKKPVKAVDSEKVIMPTYLVLGTFATTPKIHFDRVILGQSKMRTLIIRNPTEHDVYFRFMKHPGKGFSLSCELENNIPAGGQLNIDVVWKPEEVGSCFQSLTCQSNLSGIKMSIHLMGECAAPPPQKKGHKFRPPALHAIPIPTSGSLGSGNRNSISVPGPSPVFKQPEPYNKMKEISTGAKDGPGTQSSTAFSFDQPFTIRRETFNVDKENSPHRHNFNIQPVFEPKTPPNSASVMSSMSLGMLTPTPDKSILVNRIPCAGISSTNLAESIVEYSNSSSNSSTPGSRRETYVLDEIDEENQGTYEEIDEILEHFSGMLGALAGL